MPPSARPRRRARHRLTRFGLAASGSGAVTVRRRHSAKPTAATAASAPRTRIAAAPPGPGPEVGRSVSHRECPREVVRRLGEGGREERAGGSRGSVEPGRGQRRGTLDVRERARDDLRRLGPAVADPSGHVDDLSGHEARAELDRIVGEAYDAGRGPIVEMEPRSVGAFQSAADADDAVGVLGERREGRDRRATMRRRPIRRRCLLPRRRRRHRRRRLVASIVIVVAAPDRGAEADVVLGTRHDREALVGRGRMRATDDPGDRRRGALGERGRRDAGCPPRRRSAGRRRHRARPRRATCRRRASRPRSGRRPRRGATRQTLSARGAGPPA